MKKISDKLYSWASIIDEVTLEQAERTSRLPIITPHLALMPDAHLGAGSTVGSVIPTKGAIIPAAVGVDIGCGMIAVKTQFKHGDITKPLGELRHSIERSVPLSAGSYNRKLTDSAKKRVEYLESKATKDYKKISHNWPLQLGTLGSGNHFIEVTLDEDSNIWLFLHSGSRGVGNKIALHHIGVAKRQCQQAGLSLEDPDLAYLSEGTPEFAEYNADLNWAQEFALLNREEMMDRAVKDLRYFMGEEVQELDRINCHHNFSQTETHFGQQLWISRKGAIEAGVGKKGLIPGSMGTASYVVVGKGCAESYNSSPHGAGRVYSRSMARKTFTHDQLREAMKGIEYRDTDAFLDEIPQAYKDIDQIMVDAADLVEVTHTLRQIVNVKGD